MELKGKLEQKLTVESGVSKADKPWTKQTIIINNGDQYNPQTAISFFGDDKVKMLEKFNVGDELTIGVNVSSREHNGRWYNEIGGWKVDGSQLANKESNGSEDDLLPF